jgi:hypothetical protein
MRRTMLLRFAVLGIVLLGAVLWIAWTVNRSPQRQDTIDKATGRASRMLAPDTSPPRFANP